MSKLRHDNGVRVCRARAIHARILHAIHGRLLGNRLRGGLRGGVGRVAHRISIAKVV